MPQNESLESLAQKKLAEIYKIFVTEATGLTTNEALKRLQTNGYNTLAKEKKLNWFETFLRNFKNPLVLILLFAAILSFILGEVSGGVIIICIVFLSTILNFTQEYQAGKAAETLQEKVAPYATVLRDKKEQEIPVARLCVGDIILLSAGDLVPADARVIESKDFFVNQSSLTGESFPVEKDSEVVTSKIPTLSALTNIIYSGSSIMTGNARAVVVKTGSATEIGKIGEKLTQLPKDDDFVKGIKRFSYFIMRITIFLVLFIFLFNTIIKHTPLFDSFTFAVALAVGLTPELLPMIMSVTMSRGSVKMAKKGAIVKRLSAIPSFGSMDILCTDKTGTLTEAHIELVNYLDLSGKHSEKVLLYGYLNSLYQTGVKNPLDEAIIRYKKEDLAGYEKVDEIPFDFVRKRTSIVVKEKNDYVLITKGAPEEVFRIATHYRQNGKEVVFSGEKKATIESLYHKLSSSGYRVIAIGCKKLSNKKKTYTKEDEKDIELLGFISFLDPAKKGVKEILQAINKMGIEVKVITGDNELTTEKICTDVGITVKGILTSLQLSQMTNDALKVKVEQTTIFARLSPDDKNRIIQALKNNNHVVGYMGDGINDAPSLITADVGISVANAVDVTREAAAIILTHKSLAELKEGILEGRKTFGNTMKYIQMGIGSNFGNMLSVTGAVFFIPFLPMLSIQILLNNLLYDLSQITLPSDNVDEEFISHPKRWNMQFIEKFMLVFGSISSVFDFITFFFLLAVFRLSPSGFQTGWFVESIITQTIVIHIIRTRHLPFIESRSSLPLFISTFSVIFVGLFIALSAIGKLFKFSPLPLPVIGVIFLIAICYLLTTEFIKEYFYKWTNI